MKNKSISEGMKKFWQDKESEYLAKVNQKRSNTLKNQCIWLKKENEKPFPCNIELVLSKLADGYLIVNTEKNLKKVYSFFGEVPGFFFAEKN